VGLKRRKGEGGKNSAKKTVVEEQRLSDIACPAFLQVEHLD
jgi:hypothetical protein